MLINHDLNTLLDVHQGPILLAWFKFNPNMDK